MFKRPKMKYTDMCIWIDANAYSDDCDETKLFEYLYHIIRMLAFKSKYFSDWRKYDDFSFDAATRMFLKFRRRKKKGDRIKSVLNYLKSSLHFLKIDYERSTYSQQPDVESKEYKDSVVFDLLDDRINELAIFEFRQYVLDISTTFRKYVSSLPYSSDKALTENIYISCILSFISSITPPKSMHGDIEDKIRKTQLMDNTVLYHLDESYRPYIKVIVNKLKRIVCVELSDDLQSDVRPETVLGEVGFYGAEPVDED